MREQDLEQARPRALRQDDELPVVSRLVIEIRSDGSRTVARGAIEDAPSGMKVAMRASADSPVELVLKLLRSALTMPSLARSAARALKGRTRPAQGPA